jgi:hypothetical protein
MKSPSTSVSSPESTRSVAPFWSPLRPAIGRWIDSTPSSAGVGEWSRSFSPRKSMIVFRPRAWSWAAPAASRSPSWSDR